MNTSGRLLLALTTKQPPMSSTDHGGGERRGEGIPNSVSNLFGIRADYYVWLTR
jgi:hypothetical protein